MWLAFLRAKYLAEMRADFRQYYHICADDIGKSISVSEAADLAAMLPLRSRCMSAENPRLSWDVEHYLLANIADTLSYFFWSTTKDGADGRNRPDLIERPGELLRVETKGKGRTIEECNEILNRKRVNEDGH